MDPIEQFLIWYQDAVAAGERYPDAMTLATVGPEGRPSARIVLYKGILQGGLTFYTNYDSRKAQEIALNPDGGVTFFWPHLYRQVRFEGAVEKLERRASEAYFATRPREAQIGAWASRQSSPMQSPTDFETSLREMERRFPSGPVPCPPFWGGFKLVPRYAEFWTGKEARLHERMAYTRSAEGRWIATALFP